MLKNNKYTQLTNEWKTNACIILIYRQNDSTLEKCAKNRNETHEKP